jgi:chorismate synthase
MKEASLAVKGRHDVCIVPRAVAVVESMMAVVLCDFAMRAGLIPRVIK